MNSLSFLSREKLNMSVRFTTQVLKEFIVQLQTFTTSDYLIEKNCYEKISCRIERKNEKKLFNSFEISKNIISTFSGRALISQNDSLDVLLLDEYFL